jgi:hypothetical protein
VPTLIGRILGMLSLAGVIALAGFIYTVENDRAVFSIAGIGFDPFPLQTAKRTYFVISVKNIGRNYGAIEGAAIDRVSNLPAIPTYDANKIDEAQIDGGKELEIYSDLGDKPLFFTSKEISDISNGTVPFKVAGFVKYRDRYWLGKGIVGFCQI